MSKQKYKGTVILPDINVNDATIFSNDCWGYAISKVVDGDTVLYELHACQDPDNVPAGSPDKVMIGLFGDDNPRENALSALEDLLQAIDRGDRVFEFQMI